MSNLLSQNSRGRGSGDNRADDPWRRLFLGRLRQLVGERREQSPSPEVGDFDLRLLNKAVYSTFCDCLDLGAGDEARAILRQEGAGTTQTREADRN